MSRDSRSSTVFTSCSSYSCIGVPRIWQGEGKNYFFSMGNLDVASPYALLGGSGACSPDTIVQVGRFWCIFGSDFYVTRCTRGVRVVFPRARMRSSNSARMNKSNFTTEKFV